MFSPIPDKRNSPPRIIPETINPATIDKTYGPNCDLPFSVSVEDPDVADRIRVRWFVYPPGGTPEIAFDAPQIPPSVPATARRAKSASAQEQTALKSPASELSQNGEHRLAVFISDGAWVGTTDTEKRTLTMPDGGIVEDFTYTDSHVWVVTTDSTLACP